MPCIICPQGCGTVWRGRLTVDAIAWTRLVHVDTWRMVPNRQEATKKRTSDTGGSAVKFCQDIVDWTFEITNTLCIDDWLYSDILTDQTNPSVGVQAWFYFGWDCTHAPPPLGTNADPSVVDQTTLTGGTGHSNGGIYAFGQVNPPGFGIDNNGTDPATGDWTLDVSLGPYMPEDAGTAGVGPYSISDEDPTNTESAV